MNGKGIFRAGATLLWRRQRVLWWLFGADFFIGLLASVPLRSHLNSLNTSIAAQLSLYHQFNLFRLDDALSRPDAPHGGVQAVALALVAIYFVFLLFAMGGVLESLYTDTTPRFADFLQASAGYFWRMVRLSIVFGLLMIPLLAAQSGIGPLNDWIGNHSSSERLTFAVSVAIFGVLALIALGVRVWIDLAQLDCVAHERRAIRPAIGHAWQLLRQGFWRVYGAIIAIQIIVGALTMALLWIWTKLPHEAIGRVFLLGQLIVLVWIGGRLWQKAAETAFYHQRDVVGDHDVQSVAVTNQPAISVEEPAPNPSI